MLPYANQIGLRHACIPTWECENPRVENKYENKYRSRSRLSDKKRVESRQHRGSSSRIAMSFPVLAGACMQLAKVVDQARACLFARSLKGVWAAFSTVDDELGLLAIPRIAQLNLFNVLVHDFARFARRLLSGWDGLVAEGVELSVVPTRLPPEDLPGAKTRWGAILWGRERESIKDGRESIVS